MNSDAAVDDIEITNGECYSEATCDFEDDYCGYSNTKEGDDIDWKRTRGLKTKPELGPSVDTTTSTDLGYFVAVQNPNDKRGEKAWLISELFSTPSSGCLNYFLFMKGNKELTLNIYSRERYRDMKLLHSHKVEKH